MSRYKKEPPIFKFATASTKILVLAVILLTLSALMYGLNILLLKWSDSFNSNPLFNISVDSLKLPYVEVLICSIVLMLVACIVKAFRTDSSKIRLMILRRFYDSAYGNPLGLRENDYEPPVKVKKIGNMEFEISIKATSCTVDELQKVSSCISSGLNKKGFRRFAVVETNTDVASNEVRFRIEDVTVDKSLVIHDVKELTPKDPTKLIIQRGTYIDLTTSGSLLVSGKTRSGKTTGIISIILQVLLEGRDKHNSSVTIIDPKNAELSQLRGTFGLDVDGEATGIMGAISDFAELVKSRQQVLNNLSDKKGDAVHWWDAEANMRVSILYVDEYVALRSILPKKAPKDSLGYNLETFDNLIKQIITMGASAGCYVIISIAEASVESGGLPSMLRSACSTKILFRPTLPEGRLLWDSDKIKDLPERTYNAGDCWFSSTDGIHDRVTYAHFPVMKFKVYWELGRLLLAYYSGTQN